MCTARHSVTVQQCLLSHQPQTPSRLHSTAHSRCTGGHCCIHMAGHLPRICLKQSQQHPGVCCCTDLSLEGCNTSTRRQPRQHVRCSHAQAAPCQGFQWNQLTHRHANPWEGRSSPRPTCAYRSSMLACDTCFWSQPHGCSCMAQPGCSTAASILVVCWLAQQEELAAHRCSIHSARLCRGKGMYRYTQWRGRGGRG
jgi:hypothetical protein